MAELIDFAIHNEMNISKHKFYFISPWLGSNFDRIQVNPTTVKYFQNNMHMFADELLHNKIMVEELIVDIPAQV